MNKKKVVFVSGTRADYGKMKPLIKTVEKDDRFEVYIFVCGMHLLKEFGSTYEEVTKDGYDNVHVAYGLIPSKDASTNLGNTVSYFSGYIDNIMPDMIVVHGDRMDALAGAMVGALKNIMVAHIEGGELSGTIDESIRHAISKFAHVHFVCNEEAKSRLLQLGEEENRIYVIGSPDIDIMMSSNLPTLNEVKSRYEIRFEQYAILMYHPVTTESDTIRNKIRTVVDAIIESKKNYVVIYPNNDLGSDIIISEYERIKKIEKFRVFPSIRFEYFLTLLKYANFVIGNSSAGVRESDIYGIPVIDIGTRQNGRYKISELQNMVHVNESKEEILKAIENIGEYRIEGHFFGNGKSSEKFAEIISDGKFWNTELQKQFVDIN